MGESGQSCGFGVALLLWFVRATRTWQNAPISGPLMLERSHELARKFGLHLQQIVERLKKDTAVF